MKGSVTEVPMERHLETLVKDSVADVSMVHHEEITIKDSVTDVIAMTLGDNNQR